MNSLVLEETIISKLFLLRGQKILLDFDLAQLYQIETKKFNQAVKRNENRFPSDFMFQVTDEEFKYVKTLRYKINGKFYTKYLPYAFTEQGVAMLSSVLNSDRAIQINIAIMRTFVQMRSLLETNRELLAKIQDLEKHTEEKFNKQDEKIGEIFTAIKYLIKENSKPKDRIGFNL